MQVAQILNSLHDRYPIAAAIALLARATGMRLREAILADLPRLTREAERLGRINIQDGTKGGRRGASAPRWINLNRSISDALKYAEQMSPEGSHNFLGPQQSYRDFQQKVVRPARLLLHENGLKGFHELRAAYACSRYEQITNHAAPINGGKCRKLDPDLDRSARLTISYELGHSRIDIVSAYIGGQT